MGGRIYKSRREGQPRNREEKQQTEDEEISQKPACFRIFAMKRNLSPDPVKKKKGRVRIGGKKCPYG